MWRGRNDGKVIYLYTWPNCELCGRPLDEGDGRYTRKGKKRRFCSVTCRNAHNSRVGASIRSRKQRERVARGEWQNPVTLIQDDPEKLVRWKEKVREGVRRARKQEVLEGRWKNPALSPEARAKLSRPRKHGDNPALHSALEKLRQGYRVADLTPEE